MTKSRKDYVDRYYDLFGDGSVDLEIKAVGDFLVRNVYGKTLDCGCGPVPQIWAICMPNATEIHATDVAKESVDFIKSKLENTDEWYGKFSNYQTIVEEVVGPLPKDYILNQVKKIKSFQVADMTASLPFENNYFDTAISLYSLGVLKNEIELKSAIRNIAGVLKSGGQLLHINTNGENSNDTLPEYTWQGLSQTAETLTPMLEKAGFKNIITKKVRIKEAKGMYKYDTIVLLSAIKQ